MPSPDTSEYSSPAPLSASQANPQIPTRHPTMFTAKRKCNRGGCFGRRLWSCYMRIKDTLNMTEANRAKQYPKFMIDARGELKTEYLGSLGLGPRRCAWCFPQDESAVTNRAQLALSRFANAEFLRHTSYARKPPVHASCPHINRTSAASCLRMKHSSRHQISTAHTNKILRIDWFEIRRNTLRFASKVSHGLA